MSKIYSYRPIGEKITYYIAAWYDVIDSTTYENDFYIQTEWYDRTENGSTGTMTSYLATSDGMIR